MKVYMVTTPVFFIEFLGTLFLQAAIVYLNIYLLIPRLLFARKYVYYALSLCFSIAIIIVVTILINKVYSHFGSKLYANVSTFTLHNLVLFFIDIFYLVGLTTGIKFVKDSLVNRQWMEEKEKQYLETELNFLKTQIQPTSSSIPSITCIR